MSNSHASPGLHRTIDRDIRYAMQNAISEGTGSFSLHDIAPTHTWRAALRGDANQFLVGSALHGALNALRPLGALPIDAERCSTTPPGGAVTRADMSLARHWLATGLRARTDPHIQQSSITATLAARGWLTHALRTTSLILAIYTVASQAGERSRAALT